MSDDQLLTTEEVASELRIEARTVMFWIRSGKLPHVDLGYRTKRVRRSVLEDFKSKAARGVDVCSK